MLRNEDMQSHQTGQHAEDCLLSDREISETLLSITVSPAVKELPPKCRRERRFRVPLSGYPLPESFSNTNRPSIISQIWYNDEIAFLKVTMEENENQRERERERESKTHC